MLFPVRMSFLVFFASILSCVCHGFAVLSEFVLVRGPPPSNLAGSPGVQAKEERESGPWPLPAVIGFCKKRSLYQSLDSSA